MSFFKDYAIALVLLPLTIMGLYFAASGTGGFWSKYSYTISDADNTSMQSFDTLNDINQQAVIMVCDINPEAEACADVPVNSLSQVVEISFINRMVRGGYATLVTLIKLFQFPQQLLMDLMSTLNVPPYFIVGFYTILLLMIVMSVIFFIFTRSDSGI